MKILTEEELAMKLEFRRPLHPLPEEKPTAWCIPFEYGANERGTRISIPKAREIAALLLRDVAEAEKRTIFEAYEYENKQVESLKALVSETEHKVIEARAELADLKRRRKKST